jgi:formylmethanofuran dehydrogenase subunit E
MAGSANPRADIETLIRQGDLAGLLTKAGELHGHFCPGVALGVRAGYIGVRELSARSVGMERVVAIVETNSCFSDGVQMVTGCTLGNNALIYRDLGKTAVTVAKRGGRAIRVAVKPGFSEDFASRHPEAQALFDRIVVHREEVSEEEQQRLMALWREASFQQLNPPEQEVFEVKERQIELPPFAPIFGSARCAACGEKVMETRARVRDGEHACLECASAQYYVLDGSGISVAGERSRTPG